MNRPRTIITTDLECDDMNSLIHLCLYLNELEVEGIVYTASQYHFNGDGVHALGEVTPHYCCQGLLETEGHIGTRHPDPAAKDLYAYRPFEEGWIERLFDREYREAYPFLKQNAEGYPTPDEMIARVNYGNYQFEGDVRFETEGSRMIADAILDARTDPLYLQSWGGANTIVRALLSVYERCSTSPDWETIRKKVTDKVRILGIWNGEGQDNSFLDCRIPELFPGIVCLRSEFGYISFLSAKTAQPDVLPLMKGEYLFPHFKEGHGSLMAKYCLYGDGTVFQGEAEKYQFGLRPVLDWSYDGMPVFTFDRYDMLGEGDSACFMPLLDFGLGGLKDPRRCTVLGRLSRDEIRPKKEGIPFGDLMSARPKDNPFLRACLEDFAARAAWCHLPKELCSHSPKVRVERETIAAAPGETVRLSASVEAEGPYEACWRLYPEAGSCRESVSFEAAGTGAEFMVPGDAVPGDWMILILTAKSKAADPMTGYGQVLVEVR